jgi:hypothetical protein
VAQVSGIPSASGAEDYESRQVPEIGFLSNEFPNCTSKITKARSFLARNFCSIRNGLAFIASHEKFGNYSLQASGSAPVSN